MSFKTGRINRQRVIKDILSWRVENDSSLGIGLTTQNQLAALQRHLQRMADWQLEEYWRKTVGLWLDSRDDIKSTDEEWRKLQQGNQSYGYSV